MRNGKIAFTLIIAAYMLLVAAAAPMHASAVPGYNYSVWGEAEPAPVPYVARQVIYGADLGIGDFSEPQDVFVGPDRQVYVADTGNNRIVILDERGRLVRVIDAYKNGEVKETFQKPDGLFVDRNQQLYIADTHHRRVVQLNARGEFVKVVQAPQSPLLPDNFQFVPQKIAVDHAGRIYVISQGNFEGIMEFDAAGEFRAYVGTNKVRFSAADLLWKKISTQEQSRQMVLFLPVEFNNLDIDSRNFIYTVSPGSRAGNAIQRFNPHGSDVLRRLGNNPPVGDIVGKLPSLFIDIVADRSGMYSGLDSQRNRIFTYDREGHLLYQFGGTGGGEGDFRQPTAIAMLEDEVVVADAKANRITIFEPTRYGLMIRGAVVAQQTGEETRAAQLWQDVLKLNANNELAYSNIGKVMLSNNDYQGAMKHFRLGYNRDDYSEAFKRFRQQFLWNHFGSLLASTIAAVAALMLAFRWQAKRRRNVAYTEIGIYQAPVYTMLHPFKGFWELKYEQKGRVRLACLFMLLLVIVVIVKRQYTGFVFNYNRLYELNSLEEFSYIAIPLLLWCVSNWSLTTLMDGEGKFSEIVVVAGYALLPIILLLSMQVGLSNLATREESAFIFLLQALAYLWFVWLLFVGTMTIHQYSIWKTVSTMLLSLVMMGFIVFIGLLCFSLFQQMYMFLLSLYREVSMRLLGGSM